MSLPPRFDITATQIETVVREFYTKARQHEVLGPIFAAKVRDWPAHEDKIAAFWRNAILNERAYSGNPMQAHRLAGNVKDWHFAIWLEEFDQVLECNLAPHTAAAWSALAHRIGAGLRFGLVIDTPTAPGTPRRVPDLGLR